MAVQLPTRRLVAQDDAAMIQRPDVPRSQFLNTWTRKTAFDAGYLVPILVEEILPGDHMTYDVTAYLRMQTPLFPMFDQQRIDTFFFFVPSRLLWTNWPRMMGEQPEPSATIDYTLPLITSPTGGDPVGGIHDHMGIPVEGQIGAAEQIEYNALPFRAYNLIWNSWFRDQNIQSSVTVTLADGFDLTNYQLLRRAKSHDYFTSALPWPQKFTAPTVPLAGQAPVLGIGAISGDAADGPITVRESDETTSSYLFYKQLWDAAAINQVVMQMTPDEPDAFPAVFADLSQATGVAINTLRQAWLVQSLLERDARGGTRYVELIRSHFGVTNPDFRLQRPEYIGGGQSNLTLTAIAQTAPTAGVPLGALGAAATAVGQHRASYAATEHGYILGLINVRSELSYQQGLHKMWSRLSRYDFYVPSLAGLGEQAILRKELYATGNATNDNTVFGYQERWHEYRTRVSEITGVMRSTAGSDTLDAWHLAQNFSAPPTLSEAFIQDDPPMERVLAAAELANNQQYFADIQFRRRAVRPIPTFGTPVALGRF